MQSSNSHQHKALVKRYDAIQDEKFLILLLNSRDLPKIEYVPKLGAASFIDDEIVAMGFIRQCEGKMGIWDGLITRSNAPSHIRKQALDELITYLCDLARKEGMESLLCWTEDYSIIKRALEIGFKEKKLTLMAMDLKR